jgi:hypothetical protein
MDNGKIKSPPGFSLHKEHIVFSSLFSAKGDLGEIGWERQVDRRTFGYYIYGYKIYKKETPQC